MTPIPLSNTIPAPASVNDGNRLMLVRGNSLRPFLSLGAPDSDTTFVWDAQGANCIKPGSFTDRADTRPPARDRRNEVSSGPAKIVNDSLLARCQNRFAQAFRQTTGSGLGMCG